MATTIFQQMKAVRLKLPEIAPKLFHIRTKDQGIIGPTKENPLVLSDAQKLFLSSEDIGSDIILKARQLGWSTMTVLEFLAYAIFVEGFNGAIISEDRDKTKKLLRIAHLAIDMMPQEYKVPNDHSREDYIIFKPPPEGTGSSLYIGTAGTSHFGRGDTIHAAHCSELGLWTEAEELLNGLEESVPLREGAVLRIESTAFGRGNHFHRLCERAFHNRGGRYKGWFFPWWFSLDDEYRIPLDGKVIVFTDEEKELIEQVNDKFNFVLTEEHINWRRTKIDQKGIDKFLQEYPEDPESCFLSTGNAVFYGIMSMLLKTVKKIRYREPLMVENLRGVDIKRYRMPKAGENYAIVVDTSEGTKLSSAFDAITVWKVKEEGDGIEQMLSGSGRVDSNSLTMAIVDLAKEHNNALIAVERANKGFSILDKLLDADLRLGLDIYHHTEFDQEDQKHKQIPGWRPTQSSKAAAIGKLEEMFKTGEIIIHDAEIIDQMMAYQYNPNTGKAEPPEGTYSDLLTTTYIAAYIAEDIEVNSTYGVKSLLD